MTASTPTAVGANHGRVARILIDHGADVNAVFRGTSVLSQAKSSRTMLLQQEQRGATSYAGLPLETVKRENAAIIDLLQAHNAH